MRRAILLATALATALALTVPAGAQSDEPIERSDRQLPEHVEELKLATPRTGESVSLDTLHPSLRGATGDQQVIVRLVGDSLAESGITSEAQQARYVAAVRRTQNALVGRIRGFDSGARLLGQAQRVINAVFVEVDASALDEIASDDAVAQVTPVGNYELLLDETVPYIGAGAVHDAGFDGSGISVAVLDSGVDYYHANLGGSGDPADYAADDPTIIEPGTFPTAKVVGGFDFVGDQWPQGPLAFDPDPLDSGPEAGHGTHVADIIGGLGGVAPGTDLYAVKVCSSVSTSCSGVALILAMEFSVDPNFDGKVKDRVDVINMSLGALYGQPFDDDLSHAVDGATALGVLTVAAAGNSADKPFIVATPSAAETALSVAQTQVPSALLVQMEVIEPAEEAGLYEAVHQPWSAQLTTAIELPVQYGDGAGGALDGCSTGDDPNAPSGFSPFPAGSLEGKIVAVDRGTCFFSTKIQNIEAGGGELGIIMLVAPGAPFPGGFGAGEPPTIPGYMISQADGDILRGGDAVVRFDPAAGIPLVGTMVGSSSRGPQFDDQRIKPEIGAPGASVSAEVGTGDGSTPFGGTSGASPMVAGSAALVLDALGSSKTTGTGSPPGKAVGFGLTPLQVKALLMNTGETEIDTDPFTGLAPISRIGGGEVRVDRALNASAIAYDADEPSGGLSFFYNDVTDVTVITKTVEVMNLTPKKQTYSIGATFRSPGPEGSGAVSVSAPSSVTLNPGKFQTTQFEVTMTINGSLLSGNPMNSGSQGANPDALTAAEFDGLLTLVGGSEPIHLPWHVLPRKAAEVEEERTQIVSAFPDVIGLTNHGVGTAQLDAYSMVAVSPDLPEGGPGEQAPTPDIAAVGVTTFPVPAGFCSGQASFVWAFAFDMHERITHAVVPASFWIDLDTDGDEIPDFAVFTWDLAGIPNLGDGRVVTWAAPYTNYPTEIGGQSAFFFAEHATVTGNTVLYICGEQIGLTGTDMLATNVEAQAFAFDIYFGGPSDATDLFTITPSGEQFFGVPIGDGVNFFTDLPGNDSGLIAIFDFGPFPGNTPEHGVLLVTNGDRGGGNRGGATEETEAIHFLAP
jgi:subtilisin family serine protease